MTIVSRLTSNVRGLNQSIRNSLDTQSLIDTAEGGLQEISNSLQRIRELAVQSASDTNTVSDRANLNNEAQQLLAGIDAIASGTTWAGQNLLDGTFTNKSFQVGAGSLNGDRLVASIAGSSASGLGLSGTVSTLKSINVTGPTTIGNSSNSQHTAFSAKPNDDGFLLSFTTVPNRGGSGGVYIQKTDASGGAAGTRIAIDTAGNVGAPNSAYLENGNTAVTYTKYQSDGFRDQIVVLFDQNLTEISRFTANDGEVQGDYINGRIENLGNSKFIVKWDYNPNHPQLDARGSKAQLFNYDGTKNGANFQVSSDNPTYAATEIASFSDTHLGAIVRSKIAGDNKYYFEVYDLQSKNKLNSMLFSDGGDDNNVERNPKLVTTTEGFAVSWTEGSLADGYVKFFDKTGIATSSAIKIGENVNRISEIVTRTLGDGSVVSEIFWGSTDNGAASTNYTQITDYKAASLVTQNNIIAGYNDVMIPAIASGGNYVLFNNESYSDPIKAFNIVVEMSGASSLISAISARGTISTIDAALQTLNSQRASLGALSNRIDHIVANNTNTSINIQASLSRIQDADFALETSKLAKSQILQQASTAMLAQANASKQNILTLLQN